VVKSSIRERKKRNGKMIRAQTKREEIFYHGLRLILLKKNRKEEGKLHKWRSRGVHLEVLKGGAMSYRPF